MAPRPVVMFTHCRVAHGSVLSAAGRWPEAEALLLAALGSEQQPVMAHRPLAVAHLAALRLDQGRVEEAAELLEPFADRLPSCAPLARVHLARGELDLAAAVVRRGLDELVGDALQRAPLLALLVEIEIGRHDLDAAELAVTELEEIGAQVGLPAVSANADRARARLLAAQGDVAGARAVLRSALARLSGGRAAYQLGEVRLQLAELLASDGDGPGGDRRGAGGAHLLRPARRAPGPRSGLGPAP